MVVNQMDSDVQRLEDRGRERPGIQKVSPGINAIHAHASKPWINSARVEAVRSVLRLRNPGPARLLLRLMDAPDVVHRTADLMRELESTHGSLKVNVCMLRNGLALHHPDQLVHTVWGEGYYVTATDVAVIRTILKTQK